MTLHRRAAAAVIALFCLLAVVVVNAAFWGGWVLDRTLPSIDESREQSIVVAHEVLGVPVRRACIGVEGDSVRFMVAESTPLSSAELASLRGRLSQGAREQCAFPARGVRSDVPGWFDWDPAPERVLDRCMYSRHVGRTLILMRTDRVVLVAHRDYGTPTPAWPDEASLAHHWHNCR